MVGNKINRVDKVIGFSATRPSSLDWQSRRCRLAGRLICFKQSCHRYWYAYSSVP
jgi:hypothetical protein